MSESRKFKFENNFKGTFLISKVTFKFTSMWCIKFTSMWYIVKKQSFLLFFTKGQEGCFFFLFFFLNEDNKGAIHAMRGQAGRSDLLKLSGRNSGLWLVRTGKIDISILTNNRNRMILSSICLYPKEESPNIFQAFEMVSFKVLRK